MRGCAPDSVDSADSRSKQWSAVPEARLYSANRINPVVSLTHPHTHIQNLTFRNLKFSSVLFPVVVFLSSGFRSLPIINFPQT